METLRTKEFPIEVELNGKPNSDITLSDPVLSAETVTVSGPVSLVRQVAKVKAIINAEELEEIWIFTQSLPAMITMAQR